MVQDLNPTQTPHWKIQWEVDLRAGTAKHADGWVFQFPTNTQPKAVDGLCIAQPNPLTREQLAVAGRISKSAFSAYVEAQLEQRKKAASLGEKRGAGRPATVSGKRVNVYLDGDSLSTAESLGNGNVSDGIRKALRIASG